MLLKFVIYLICYVLFLFFFFFKKQKTVDLKKARRLKFCNIIFLFLHKIGSVGPVDPQIDLVSPKGRIFNDYVKVTVLHKHKMENKGNVTDVVNKIEYLLSKC